MTRMLNPATTSNIWWCRLAAIMICYPLIACSDNIQKREAESYILPENYIGTFYVIFEHPTGSPPITQGNVRQFNIPDNGVLLTQTPVSEGAIAVSKLRFFRQGPGNQLAEISDRWYGSIDPEEAYQDRTTYIFGGGLGVYSSSTLECDIYFRGFHIGTQGQILDQVKHFDIETYIENNNVGCD